MLPFAPVVRLALVTFYMFLCIPPPSSIIVSNPKQAFAGAKFKFLQIHDFNILLLISSKNLVCVKFLVTSHFLRKRELNHISVRLSTCVFIQPRMCIYSTPQIMLQLLWYGAAPTCGFLHFFCFVRFVCPKKM